MRDRLLQRAPTLKAELHSINFWQENIALLAFFLRTQLIDSVNIVEKQDTGRSLSCLVENIRDHAPTSLGDAPVCKQGTLILRKINVLKLHDVVSDVIEHPNKC